MRAPTTLDFCNFTDYLDAAAKSRAHAPSVWRHAQQKHLNADHLGEFRHTVGADAEPAKNTDGPVEACQRYRYNCRHRRND